MRPHFYRPRERQYFHVHPETRIVVLWNGAFCEEGYGCEGAYSRGDFIIRPAFTGHDNRAAASGAAYLQLKRPPNFLGMRSASNCWRPMRGKIDLDDRRVRRTLASPHAAEFLADCAAAAAYAPLDGAKTLDGAAARLASGAYLNIAALAEALGMRADSFSRLFKKRFGISPRHYAKAARLERAMAQIVEGADSIAEIAASCGYFDQSHLCRAFREKLAMSPLQFARQFIS